MKFIKYLIFGVFIISAVNMTIENEQSKYTYVLSVESLTDQIESFDLEIERIDEKTNKRELFKSKSVITPYRKELQSGIYEIKLISKNKRGSIISKIQGVYEGKEVGSALGTFKKSILKVGQGSYEALKGDY